MNIATKISKKASAFKAAVTPASLTQKLALLQGEIETAGHAAAAAEQHHAEAALAHYETPTPATEKTLGEAEDALGHSKRRLAALQASARGLMDRQRAEESEKQRAQTEADRARQLRDEAEIKTLAAEVDRYAEPFVEAVDKLAAKFQAIAMEHPDTLRVVLDFRLRAQQLLNVRLHRPLATKYLPLTQQAQRFAELIPDELFARNRRQA